ncbi:hypothetical protein INT46_006751 [Mucor plumbeus]|uniref:Uncharacterized protein n=1 Tax=Mucor plumbeus TaxID=97098 RepID=A0A8H7QIN8_9FUNG|nr:hypothetical protein INT46_006751 [Mucor plumbeus]
MDFIKSNHNKTPFPIISFFDSVGVNDEQEAKKLFIDFVQEILNFDKKALSSESFTQKSRNDGYKALEGPNVKNYFISKNIEKELDNQARFLELKICVSDVLPIPFFVGKRKHESDKDSNKKQHKKHVGNETDTMQSDIDNIAANEESNIESKSDTTNDEEFPAFSQTDCDKLVIEKKTFWEEWMDLYENMKKNHLFKFSPILYNVFRVGQEKALDFIYFVNELKIELEKSLENYKKSKKNMKKLKKPEDI